MDSPPSAMRIHLKDYLAGRTSLDDLKERVIDATWDVDDRDSSPDRDLAYDIELILAEASSGYLSPEELRADLQAILDRATLEAPV